MTKYSTELKIEIVSKYLNHEDSIKGLAKQYNIHWTLIRRWIDKAKCQGLAAYVVPELGVLNAHHRDHELIGDAGVVRGLDRIGRVGGEGALAADHGVVGLLEPVPPLVPVHGVVPAHDGGDLSNAQLENILSKVKQSQKNAHGMYTLISGY